MSIWTQIWSGTLEGFVLVAAMLTIYAIWNRKAQK